jgi:hypothetical protein
MTFQFECWGARPDEALLLGFDVDPKETLSSKSRRSPRLEVDPMLLLVMTVERLPPVDPMGDADDAVDDADASAVEPEQIGFDR